jgi:cytochrome P450
VTVPFKDLPTIDTAPVVGALADFFGNPLDLYERAASAGAPMVRTHILKSPMAIVCDPELVQAVIRTKEDSFSRGFLFDLTISEFAPEGVFARPADSVWRTHRLTAQRLFRPDLVAEWIPTIRRTTELFISEFDDYGELDFYQYTRKLTLSIALRTFMGLGEFPSHTEAEVLDAIEGLVSRFRSPLNTVLPARAPTMTNRRFRRSRRLLHETVENCLQSDAASGPSITTRLRTEFDLSDPTERKQVCDDLLTYLIAGHDTVAGALAYGCLLLSRNATVQERVAAEAETILSDPSLTMIDSPEATYTDRFVRETLRIFPPVPHTPRGTTETVCIGEYTLPSGTAVVLPQWVIHRAPTHFADPLSVRPDRWIDNPPDHEFAFFPFGGGRRHCMGRRYGLSLLRLVLPMLASGLAFEPPTQEVETSAAITLYPVDGVPLQVQPAQ